MGYHTALIAVFKSLIKTLVSVLKAPLAPPTPAPAQSATVLIHTEQRYKTRVFVEYRTVQYEALCLCIIKRHVMKLQREPSACFGVPTFEIFQAVLTN